MRQLAAEADSIATTGTKPKARPGGRHRATLDAIRQELGYHAAWARWSASIDELARLGDTIGRIEVGTLADLVVQFDVLVWMLIDDRAVVDTEAQRRVLVFRRSLRRLARLA